MSALCCWAILACSCLSFNLNELVGTACSGKLRIECFPHALLQSISVDRGDSTATLSCVLELVDMLDVFTFWGNEGVFPRRVSFLVVEAGDDSVLVGVVDNLGQLIDGTFGGDVESIDSLDKFITIELHNLIFLSPASTSKTIV